jgi:hypothetical protein
MATKHNLTVCYFVGKGTGFDKKSLQKQKPF